MNNSNSSTLSMSLTSFALFCIGIGLLLAKVTPTVSFLLAVCTVAVSICIAVITILGSTNMSNRKKNRVSKGKNKIEQEPVVEISTGRQHDIVAPPVEQYTVEKSVAKPLASISALATDPGGKSSGKNEDACELGCNANCRVMAIADGVSNQANSEVVSRAAVETFVEFISKAASTQEVIGKQTITFAYDAIKEAIVHAVEKNSFNQSNPSTTFIGIIELSNQFIITYIGDGAIYLIDAYGNAANLLIPHKTYNTTRALTYKNCLGNPSVPFPKFAYIEISKSLTGGEIIIAGTDGAFMPSKQKTMCDRLFEILKYKGGNSTEDDQNSRDELQTDIAELLGNMIKKGENMDPNDNRTLGVMITSEAIKTWRNPVNLQSEYRDPFRNQTSIK